MFQISLVIEEHSSPLTALPMTLVTSMVLTEEGIRMKEEELLQYFRAKHPSISAVNIFDYKEFA